MSTNRCFLAASGRRMALLGAILVLLACLPLASGWTAPPAGDRPSPNKAPGESSSPGPTGGVSGTQGAPHRGEKRRAAELLEAEQLYRRALTSPDINLRIQATERLLTLYVRLGRIDQAIQVGLQYRQLLRQSAAVLHQGEEFLGRLRELDARLGEWYLALGHYSTAEDYLKQAVTDVPDSSSLPPLHKLTALGDLARSAEKRGDHPRADRLWRSVEEFARAQLDRPGTTLTVRQQIEFTWKLADCYGHLKEPARAIARLERLLPIHDQLHDGTGKRDTLRRLAGHHAARGEYGKAEAYLRRALDAPAAAGVAARITHAELAGELAEMLAQQGQAAEAVRWWNRAAADYQAILNPPEGDRPDVGQVVAAFWELQALYQKGTQYRKALQLAETQGEQWGVILTGPKLTSEQGTLQILLGSFARARTLLREAVADLERRSPINRVDLPRALNNLAIVEQATGELDRAEKLARRCLELYQKDQLPDDLLVVEAHNVLGACAAQRGDYVHGLEWFREGASRCEKLGRAADSQRCNLLLNLALLYKSQGDLTRALSACQQAQDVYQRFAPPDALGWAAFNAARASLYAAQGHIQEAYALTPRILELCRKYEIDKGPMVITALHCQGLYYLARRQFAAADEAWSQVRALQEQEKSPLLLPRTLNYLGLSADLRGDFKRAEALYRQALELQQSSRRVFPVIHFITLWRLARVADQGGRKIEARRLLEKAIEVVEEARLQTWGDAEQRATFFAQFQPGLDQLVDWCVRDGDLEGALSAATRGRSRTLLDQLQLAGADPRAGLRGPRGEQLLRKEEQLRQEINGLRARAQLMPVEAVGQDEARKLLADLEQAQKSYAEVWREVLNASPVYRNLSAQDSVRNVLPSLRKSVLGPKTVLLVYYLGRKHSYVLLFGGSSTHPEAFPLTAPADAPLALAAAAPPPSTEPSEMSVRGLAVGSLRKPSELVVRVEPVGRGMVWLNQNLARTLVDGYLDQVAAPRFQATRGLRVKSPRTHQEVLPRGLEVLGHVLLPAAVRDRVRELRPECLVVIPDGPLHKLPLEALLLESSPRPRYVLDELPPIIYAPSAAVLTQLAKRTGPVRRSPLSLLTVSNPAYPQAKAVVTAGTRAGPQQPVGLRGQLILLPFTAEESRRIQRFFDPARVTSLEGSRATERAVTAAVAGQGVVHLAVHGFAHENLGNLFGALALTPPPPDQETGEDDGFLSLHEIYTLPLKDCELAVLSACATNVGPQPPLEAGVTLAGAFLAAGAHRVVASHWTVADESTATLMEAFFEEVAASAERGEAVRYAQALQRARLKVRHTPKWSAPFFWAPFVLIGPAE